MNMNSFFSLLTIAARNIRRNVRRTSLCIVAIAIAVFFTVLMQSMTTGMMAGMETVVQVFDTGHVSIVSADFEAEKGILPRAVSHCKWGERGGIGGGD